MSRHPGCSEYCRTLGTLKDGADGLRTAGVAQRSGDGHRTAAPLAASRGWAVVHSEYLRKCRIVRV